MKQTKPMPTARKFIIATALVAIAYAGYRYLAPGSAGEASQYRTEPTAFADLLSSISATGTLGATATVEVGTQVSGTLQSVEVDFNDSVSVGQVIARIDPSTFQARLQQSQAALSSAQAALSEARASALSADREYQRKSQLAAQQLVSKTDRDLALALRDQTAARVLSAQAQVKQQQASVNSAMLDLEKTVIRSPVDGVVLARNVEPGQTVAASLQTPVLFKIAGDLRQMEIVLAIDEADIGQVRVGQSATFTVDAFPERNFRGKVRQIRLSATNVSNVITFPVVIEVNNPDQILLPGLTATAQIVTSEKTQVLTVPNSALRFRPANASGGNAGPAFGGGGAAPPSVEERSKRLQTQLDTMAAFLVQIRADQATQQAYAASADAYKAQVAEMMQRFAQGGGQGFGAGQGGPQSQGGGPGAGSGANRSNRFAERFAKAFVSVRERLSAEQQSQWDQQIQALFNAKRATVYVLEKGEPVAVEIRLGASDGSRSEVIGGLADGQQVIVGSARQTP